MKRIILYAVLILLAVILLLPLYWTLIGSFLPQEEFAFHYGDLIRWAEEAVACGIPMYGTFLDGENIYKQELTSGGIVVMGNESQGISPALAGRISRRLWLPCLIWKICFWNL